MAVTSCEWLGGVPTREVGQGSRRTIVNGTEGSGTIPEPSCGCVFFSLLQDSTGAMFRSGRRQPPPLSAAAAELATTVANTVAVTELVLRTSIDATAIVAVKAPPGRATRRTTTTGFSRLGTAAITATASFRGTAAPRGRVNTDWSQVRTTCVSAELLLRTAGAIIRGDARP